METLTLDKALTKVREAEAIESQQPLLRSDQRDTKTDTTATVSTVHKRGPGNKNTKAVCFRCGRSPPHDRQHCPTKNVVCHKSSKRGHFKAMCRSHKKIGEVYEEPDATEYNSDKCFLGAVGTGGNNAWQVMLHLNGNPTEFQIDTGAEASIISEGIYQKSMLHALVQVLRHLFSFMERNFSGNHATHIFTSPVWCLVSQARPSHSAVFSSFRRNARREGLAHCPCAFGSMISKHDAQVRDVIQIFTQRYWPWRHKRTNLTIEPYFSMVENAQTVGQLSKYHAIHQLFTG